MFVPYCLCAENNVSANFHCGVSEALKLCYRITFVALVSLDNQPFFSVNRTYMLVRWDVREA